MKHHEKKFRVDNFDNVLQILHVLGAKKIKNASAMHYYAEQDGNDVVKFVHEGNKNEIHRLEESNGKFRLIETIPLKDTESGLRWLKNSGHLKINIVKMDYTEYSYKGGIVGLYTINDSLKSIILDCPADQHADIQKKLELDNAEVITVPFNSYYHTFNS